MLSDPVRCCLHIAKNLTIGARISDSSIGIEYCKEETEASQQTIAFLDNPDSALCICSSRTVLLISGFSSSIGEVYTCHGKES